MKKLVIILGLVLSSVLLMGQDWATYYGQMPTDTASTKDSIQFLVIDAEDDSTFYLLWSQMEATWEDELTNSAGLADALSDETGTGVAVFGTSPTFTTGITIGTNTITETDAGYLDDVDAAIDQTSLDARYENELDNSAGLASALSDESGTGAVIFQSALTDTAAAIRGDITAGTGDVLWADTTASANPGLFTQRQIDSLKALYEPLLTNSAGLRGALDDETGTGLAVFATSPTFTTSIQLGSTIIDETELSSIDGASGEAFDVDTTAWLLADTVVLASFNASDSLNTSFFYGSFYNGGSDTLVVTEMRAVLQGTTPSVTVDIEWHATFASVSAVGLNTTPPTITSTTTGDSDTTFDNAEIPPGVWVWCKTPTVTTEPTYMSVTLLGYRKNSTY